MIGLLLIFGMSLALGFFFLALSFWRLPTLGTAKAMLGTVRQERKTAKTMEAAFMVAALNLSGYIRMEEYRRSRLSKTLKASGMNLSPEVFQAYVLAKTGAVLLAMFPCLALFPLLIPVIGILAMMVYIKESQKPEERLKEKREIIEGELPRFVATIEQELKASRNVVGMLERFRGNAGELCNDIKSGINGVGVNNPE